MRLNDLPHMGQPHSDARHIPGVFQPGKAVEGLIDAAVGQVGVIGYDDPVVALIRIHPQGHPGAGEFDRVVHQLRQQRAHGLAVAGDPDGLEKTHYGLLSDVYREMRTRLLHPVVLVDYDREAYLHPAETVRITFDKNLHTGLGSIDLFNPYVPTVSPFDEPWTILEVKYDRVLPPYIAEVLAWAVPEACRSAVSKYTWCRRFERKDDI